MRDTTALSDLDKRVSYLLDGATEAQLQALARHALVLHLVHLEIMSDAARVEFDELMRGIGPEFLLAFRVLREEGRKIIRYRRNWRRRT